MTPPDPSTPEGRAALRAVVEFGPDGFLAWARAMPAVMGALEAAHATIERLTAPVTAAEVLAMAELYNGSPVNDASDLYDMRGLLDAFIARRKEQAP